MKLSRNRFNYAWVIVGACFLLELIISGFAAGYRGLYLVAVTDGLQIPRSLFSISESAHLLRTLIYVGVMTVLFVLSYMIQQRWVFAPQKQNDPHEVK